MSTPPTEIIPGIECPIAEMTRRICGTTEISRKTRKILKALKTARAPDAGTQAIVTMVRSNKFHPDLKKSKR